MIGALRVNAHTSFCSFSQNTKGKQEKVLKEPEIKLEPEKDKQPDKLIEGLNSSNDEKNTLEKVNCDNFNFIFLG